MLGFPLLTLLLPAQREYRALVFSLSYLVGGLIAVLSMSISSMLIGQFSWTVVAVVLLASWTYCVHTQGRGLLNTLRVEREYIVFALALVLVLLPYSILAFDVPLSAWDARSIWFFHAKAFYFDNSIRLEYLLNPFYRWSHPEYPPMFPLLTAWHAFFLGSWSEYLAKSYLLVHLYFVLLSFYGLLRLLAVSKWSAALVVASLPLLFAENLLIGYADTFYSSFFVLGMLTVFVGWRKEEFLAFGLLGALLFVSAALSKQEGFYFSLVFFLALLGCLPFHRFRLRAALGMLFLFIMLSSIWYVYRAVNGVESEYAWSVLETVSAWNVPEVVLVVTQGLELIVARWGAALCVLYLLTVILSILKAKRFDAMMLALLLLALPVVFVAIYRGAPVDADWLLRTSVDRLVIVVFFISYAGSAVLALGEAE